VVDKAEAQTRLDPETGGLFMIDASRGFMKDGLKNRLRAQDIHKIVDCFTRATELPGYARWVPLAEIERNDYNLNLPRYIDSQTREDRQDIAAHLQGGIPTEDVEALTDYWDVCPTLRDSLFVPNRPGYLDQAPNLLGDKASSPPSTVIPSSPPSSPTCRPTSPTGARAGPRTSRPSRPASIPRN